MAVEIGPVGKRAIGEIVPMRMQLVQIAEGPQRASGLDAQPVGQPRAGQGLDERFLDFQLRRAIVRSKAECEIPEELVVHIARHHDLAVAEGKPLAAALAVMADLESGNSAAAILGILCETTVEHDADGGVERVVRRGARHGRRRRRFGRRRGRGFRFGFRLQIAELRFERLDAGFVLGFQRLDLGGQFRRGRRGFGLGRRG